MKIITNRPVQFRLHDTSCWVYARQEAFLHSLLEAQRSGKKVIHPSYCDYLLNSGYVTGVKLIFALVGSLKESEMVRGGGMLA
jgi:hypothetical protein